jgi:hypothetical protein
MLQLRDARLRSEPENSSMKKAITLHDGETIEGELVESLEADFATRSWRFSIFDDTQVGAGEYIVISCVDLAKLAERRASARR